MTGITEEISIEKISVKQLDSNKHLLQTGFWARLKEQFGWTPFPVRVVNGEDAFTMLVLLRNFGLGFRLGYVPMGPEIPEPDAGKEDFLIDLAKKLSGILSCQLTFLRFDLPWGRAGKDNYPEPLVAAKFFYKSITDIQPPHTVILRIDRPDEQILDSMKHKTRYNIRLSGRKGVLVNECGSEKLDRWYDLYCETAARDRISLHSREYYSRIFSLAKEYEPAGIRIKLLNAEINGELVAGIIIAIKDETAWYLYGASSNNKRNYMPNHALQWQAIRIARNAGCRFYDFFGIPPANSPDHPMYGLYRFKTGFGGDFLHRYGCYDIALKPFSYKSYTFIEKIRSFYYKKLKKVLR